jgi:DNA repair exonuclease SbcCD ATPase subunit
MTDLDVSRLPPEAKAELRRRLAQIDADAIARVEKRLTENAARLRELDGALTSARANAEAAAAAAKAAAAASDAARPLQGLVAEHERLMHRRTDDMRELDRKRGELAAFRKRHGIAAP